MGCGPGQLAEFLLSQGVEKYTGFDLSPHAVKLAQDRNPTGEFFVGSALDPLVYNRAESALVIRTEVLEHIEQDLQVVSYFPPGQRCICTVPNFPFESHVRFFRHAEEVRSRYGHLFHQLDVMTLRSPKSDADNFFIFDGERKS